MPRPLPDWFMSRVIVDVASGCFNWRFGKSDFGYGRLFYNGKDCKAHRVAYELSTEAFDGTLQVLHSCDNPACCNPEHLFQGTQKENMLDMRSKGRQAKVRYGMSLEKARKIRQEYADGSSQSALASKYHIAKSTIHNIVHNVTWKE